ncbi:LAME_0F10990g1_1 [Lachancea meyersii CBS 8951]|uniref:Ubiquitin carboxyl-terminal hydrolase n=1 Tax=Lachancea meyersii CBS 8951 TaxID=1266667 RepID=A0A1G4JVU6_9SACH|nr:LAME_0F10990g1_1 [Lachancea meyersii CBS 8951]
MSSFKKWLSRNDKSGKTKAERAEKSQVNAQTDSDKDVGNKNIIEKPILVVEKILPAIAHSEGSKTAGSSDGKLALFSADKHLELDKSANGTSFEGAEGSQYAVSDSDSLLSEYERFPLVRPQITSLLPFGDGSNKVFGYENFGNTCYCNSVLQVIYNLPELRDHILEFPARDSGVPRRRKFQMPGVKPRIFDETSFFSQCNGNDSSKKANGGSGCNQSSGKDTGGRKNSAPHSRDRESFRSTTSARSLRSHSSATVHGTVMASDAITEKLHEGYTRIVVGRVAGKNGKTRHTQVAGSVLNSAPQSGSSVPSSSSNSSSGSSAKPLETSSEERKKAALIRGPVLNVDHNSKDYLQPNEKPGLYTALKDVYESITENRCFTGVVSPIQFVETLKRENVLFSTMMHQDAHEFLNYLLNEISDYVDARNKKGNEDESEPQTGNFVDQLFKGTLTNRTKCLTCDNETFRNEPFLDFAIEVKDDEETDIKTTLSDYHQREMLNGANKFYCDECCGLQEAERVVGLKQLPFYLALHMKRFKYSEKQNCNTKLFNKIHYPLNLKVCSTFDSSVCKQYELIGLVVHMGGGPHHGHYVSLCRTDKFGWLLFDDETVETVEESTVLKFIGNSDDLTTAYLLFYREVSDFGKDSRGSDKRQEYAEGVDQLIKLDEFTRSHLDNRCDHVGDLEGVPEERTSSKSKGSRRRSRLFSFRRSSKD